MEKIDCIERLSVSLDGEMVGTLALTESGAMAFQYCREWLENGESISPFSLPLSSRVYVAKHGSLNGMFGVFADSMPDGWGRLLVDRTLQREGFDPSRVTSIARLAIVGKSGMGALEYEPTVEFQGEEFNGDFDRIARSCAIVLQNREPDDLDELFFLGGSSGGARPKVLVSIDGEDWIVKFASSIDPKEIGAEEYAISQAAKECGIEIPETRLFPSKACKGYFGTKRFDRVGGANGGRKIHMVTAAGLLETSPSIPNLSYELLMKLTYQLTRSVNEIERLYRLMCFNVAIGNRDDHSKNFSFLLDRQSGKWKLSPAYDLTRNAGHFGRRATTVAGKDENIAISDLVEVIKPYGIEPKKAEQIAIEIFEVAEQYRLRS